MTEYPESLPHQGTPRPKRRGHSWLRDHPQAARYKRLSQQKKAEGDPCTGCGQAIDPELKGPDPLSFSLDHDPPLSAREKDAKNRPRDILTGVYPSHFGCNSSRGNRGAEGDLGVGGDDHLGLGLPWYGRYRIGERPDPAKLQLDAGNLAYGSHVGLEGRTRAGLSIEPRLVVGDLRPVEQWPWLLLDDGQAVFMTGQWAQGRRVYWLCGSVGRHAVTADPNQPPQARQARQPESDGKVESSRRW